MRLTITKKDIETSKSGPQAIDKALGRTKHQFKFVGVYYIFYENHAPRLMPDKLRDFVDNFPKVSPLWTTL